MTRRAITPSQTIGPFFAYALTPAGDGYPPLVGADLVTADAAGATIRITGRVVDGGGQAVPDAMIEIWQADGAGRHAAAPPSTRGFRGFGRASRRRRISMSASSPAGCFAACSPGSISPTRPPMPPIRSWHWWRRSAVPR